MKRTIYFILLVLFINVDLLAQAPQAFKYQAIAREVNGNIMANQTVSLQISILENNLPVNTQYAETHTATTNEYGLFNLQIGKGIPSTGIFADIPWGSGNEYWVQIAYDPTGGTNFQLMGNSQLLSVPYALYGEDADADPANELQSLSQSGSVITLSDNGGSILVNDADSSTTNELQTILSSDGSIEIGQNGIDYNLKTRWNLLPGVPSGFSDGIDNVNDGDTSSTNEIQYLIQFGDSVSLSNGGSISIEDSDADPTNEIQSINSSDNSVGVVANGNDYDIKVDWDSLPNVPSGFSDGVDNIDDADSSPINELQYISRSGNSISLTNGGGTVFIDDADADSSNELQTLSKSGNNITLSNNGGSISVNDADASSTNEIQTLSFNSSSGSISISSGNSISISALKDVDFYKVGTTSSPTSIYNNIYTYGRVGIGTDSPQVPLHVNGEISATKVSNYSDQRYKQNIRPIKVALPNLQKIQGYQYQFNLKKFPEKQFSEGTQFGLIAQNVEQVYPELVSTDQEGFKSVNYIGLIPVLLEAIKEQQAKIQQLENLANQNKQLNNRLAALESQIQQLLGETLVKKSTD